MTGRGRPYIRGRIYWDAATFIALLNREEDRHETCLEIFQATKKKGAKIYTSTLSIVEVLRVRDAKDNQLSSEQAALVSMFMEDPVIQYVEPSRFVARDARQYRWNNLGSFDSLHLASASACRAQFLETYDKKLLRLASNEVDLHGLTIRKPSHTQQMQIPVDEEQ